VRQGALRGNDKPQDSLDMIDVALFRKRLESSTSCEGSLRRILAHAVTRQDTSWGVRLSIMRAEIGGGRRDGHERC